jgi:hypothetical protein
MSQDVTLMIHSLEHEADINVRIVNEMKHHMDICKYESRNEKGVFNNRSREESESKQEDVSIRYTTKRGRTIS